MHISKLYLSHVRWNFHWPFWDVCAARALPFSHFDRIRNGAQYSHRCQPAARCISVKLWRCDKTCIHRNYRFYGTHSNQRHRVYGVNHRSALYVWAIAFAASIIAVTISDDWFNISVINIDSEKRSVRSKCLKIERDENDFPYIFSMI